MGRLQILKKLDGFKDMFSRKEKKRVKHKDSSTGSKKTSVWFNVWFPVRTT